MTLPQLENPMQLIPIINFILFECLLIRMNFSQKSSMHWVAITKNLARLEKWFNG